MNAANTAAQVRRPVAPTRPAPTARAVPAMAAAPAFDAPEDDFRLNLSDIPRMQESMEVEGLKPTLLSRLLDLVMPLNR